ncbi:hypothetical protein [Actinomadura bangladeshensis]|nr:hypothetical protein [Actinomadura bangladeshensis]
MTEEIPVVQVRRRPESMSRTATEAHGTVVGWVSLGQGAVV